MRRISTGKVGNPLLGNLFTDGTTFSTLDTADDLILSGNTVALNTNLDVVNNALRIYDGVNYASINVPPLSSNTNFTLPDSNGVNDYVLYTDGSGNLTWKAVQISVTNQAASTSTYYPVLSNQTSGSPTSFNVTASKLTFQPSSGTLTVDNLTGNISSNSVDINGGAIDNTTIGATTASSGTFTSITETSSIVLKDNITPIEDALEKIKKLNGVEYTRISTGNTESGLIAESVEKILPNLVNCQGEYKSIHYSRLSAYLIEAIKSLQHEIVLLKEK